SQAQTVGNRNPTVYPSTARVLDVTASDVPAVVGEGVAVPTTLDGTGRIAASTINAGGFDNVDLTVRDLRLSTVTVGGIGAVQFEPGVILSPAARLTIDAPEIRTSGAGSVSLSAGYVALGSSDVTTQQVTAAPVAGSGTLSVSGGFID